MNADQQHDERFVLRAIERDLDLRPGSLAIWDANAKSRTCQSGRPVTAACKQNGNQRAGQR